MKLRALNGAHSSLAYLGAVTGLETVADAMAEPLLARFLRDLWDQDLLPGIPSVPGMDLSAYTRQLENRFRNRAMRHRLQQIAMDGSQKLPQRLLLPALERVRQGHRPARIALTVAAWMRFLLRRDECGNGYEISDPLAGRLLTVAAEAGENSEALAAALFGVREIFDPALALDAGFRGLVVQHLKSLLAHGVRHALAA
jgi:fructuronate reductase